MKPSAFWALGFSMQGEDKSLPLEGKVDRSKSETDEVERLPPFNRAEWKAEAGCLRRME